MLRRTRTKPTVPNSLVIKDGEKSICVPILGVIGLRLAVQTPTGMKLISESDCLDREKFYLAWKANNTISYRWEDGTEFTGPGI